MTAHRFPQNRQASEVAHAQPHEYALEALRSDHAQQHQYQDDREDEADASASVVAPTRANAIAAVPECQNQQDQKDE